MRICLMVIMAVLLGIMSACSERTNMSEMAGYVTTWEASSGEPTDELVVFNGEDFSVLSVLNTDSSERLTIDDYYIIFSGLHFARCGDIWPTRKERLALQVLRNGDLEMVEITSGTIPSTFKTLENTEVEIGGKVIFVRRVLRSYDSLELELYLDPKTSEVLGWSNLDNNVQGHASNTRNAGFSIAEIQSFVKKRCNPGSLTQ